MERPEPAQRLLLRLQPRRRRGHLNDNEREQIQSVWQRVSEDYSAFDVDVTTQDPGDAAIDRTNAGDVNFGTRALISDNTTASAAVCPTGCGGVAYVGVFDDSGTGTNAHAYHQPAWVFGHSLANNDTKDIAEATSHEVGHNFGLSHDGNTASTSGCSNPNYYCGHAMWAPIMGVGYQKPVVQWSKGEYTNANQSQNDLNIIAGGGAPVIADEAGGTVATASPGRRSRAVITSATDADTFLLGTCSGAVTVGATGAAPSPNLDIRLELLGSDGTVLQTADPTSTYVSRDSATGLGASVSDTLAAGTYYVRVDGVGSGTSGATGYTDYGSIGAYTVTATGCATAGTPTAPTGLVVTPGGNGTSATVTWSAAHLGRRQRRHRLPAQPHRWRAGQPWAWSGRTRGPGSPRAAPTCSRSPPRTRSAPVRRPPRASRCRPRPAH